MKPCPDKKNFKKSIDITKIKINTSANNFICLKRQNYFIWNDRKKFNHINFSSKDVEKMIVSRLVHKTRYLALLIL